MLKYFRSHFPGANVQCLEEWFSTDTYISDIPAFDDGVPGHGSCTVTQIYGGCDSEFFSGHPMSTESALSSSLLDFIQ